ncbi:TPA: ATP-grasp domain-containing protein [Serratia marcescens]|nr:ATP-grasp domain-containing protein [Serratia marcescens]
MAFDDFRMIQAAIINHFLNLPYTPAVEALLTVRFKHLLREKLNNTAYAINFTLLAGDSTAHHALLKYPCMIKPVDESGSVGVKVCHSKSESDEAIDYILSLPKYNNRGFSVSKKILAEEFISGEEYSAELVWDCENEDWRLLGVTRKFVTPPPFCVEKAHIFPYADGSEFSEQVSLHANRILEHVGLRNTFVHMEFKFYGGYFYVIEINPHLGGDMIIELMKNAKGYDAAGLMLEANINQPLSIKNTGVQEDASAIVYITDSRGGHITDITVENDGGIFSQVYIFSLPKTLKGLRSSEDRLGYVILNKDRYQQIEQRVNALLEGNGFNISRSTLQ